MLPYIVFQRHILCRTLCAVPGGDGQCQLSTGTRWCQGVPGGARWYRVVRTVEAVPGGAGRFWAVPGGVRWWLDVGYGP